MNIDERLELLVKVVADLADSTKRLERTVRGMEIIALKASWDFHTRLQRLERDLKLDEET